MGNIHEVLAAISETKEKCVLATVIKVEGSAYRKEGTSMLFTGDGGQTGIISAGCLEEDLALRANQLLSKNGVQSDTIVYDMRAEDDLSWGRGAGCNGKIHVLLEKVDARYRIDLLELKTYLDRGIPVAALKIIGKDNIRTVFVSKDQHIFGNKQTVPGKLINEMGKSNTSGMTENAEENIFIHHFRPMPRLFIFGAGPDAQPFARTASQTGFAVNVWDWRPAMLRQEHFPGVHLIDGKAADTINACAFDSGDSAVIMTHDFQKDQELLHAMLAQKQIGYLGILGPRKRTARLLDDRPIPDHLHSPVGLSIGAEGPEEIAISIIAELIHVQRKTGKTNERRPRLKETGEG